MLFQYRVTPHTVSPGELLRTRLDVMKPEVQRQSRCDGSEKVKLREFQLGDDVLALNHGRSEGK